MLKFLALLALIVYHVSAAPSCCCSNCNREYPEPVQQTQIVHRIAAPAHRLVQSPVYTNPQPVNLNICEDGWEVFQDSCYYIEREQKLTLEQAESRCNKLGSSLFVANSKAEYDTIMQDAPMNFFTWTGLYKRMDGDAPRWHTADGIETDDMNWIITPYTDINNGWTTASQCAAHWNPFTSTGKYTFWYPCNYQYYFVCERNATLHNTHYQAKLFFS